jgi:hypothetical protein
MVIFLVRGDSILADGGAGNAGSKLYAGNREYCGGSVRSAAEVCDTL